MSVRFRNRSRQLVTMELNTRDTLHLAPNEESRTLEEHEVKNNSQVRKLLDRGHIEQLEQASAVDVGAKKRSARARRASAKS